MIWHMCRAWLRRLLFAMTTTALSFPALAAAPPSPADRIVAIGDLHGDHEVWITLARAARLIDRKGRWSGGRTVLVQTGDIVDRAPDSLRIIRDLMRLEKQALRAGGRVVVLVGNHEAMMVTGDLRYVHPGEYAAFADRNSPRRRDEAYAANRVAVEASYRRQDPSSSAAAIRDRWIGQTPLGKIEHQAAWHPQGEIGRWFVTKPAVARIGTSLFVHGGLSPAYATIPVDEINRRVSAALVARETDPASIINDQLGPLWYRGLAGVSAEVAPSTVPPTPAPVGPTLAIDQQLDQLFAATGARRIVIGHTPLLSGVAVTHLGRLVRIDSGNSRAYGGVPGYVEIVGEKVTANAVARPIAQGLTR